MALTAMIRRRGQGPEDEESLSDEEEDAFSALSKKDTAKKGNRSSAMPSISTAKSSASKTTSSASLVTQPSRTPLAVTSSMKRHHKPNDSRKAKMDALIQELEAEKDQIPKKSNRFIPEKKGSFVDPGEEHLTTNLFVGNLAPSITEEDLNSLFSQFGEKYITRLSGGLFLFFPFSLCRRLLSMLQALV